MNPGLQLPAQPRIAVYLIARIGDTLLATPAIRAIKETHPDSHITVHAHPKRMALLQHLPFIDSLRPLTGKSAWMHGRLGQRPYDLALAYGHDPAVIRLALRQSRAVVAFTQASPPLNQALAAAVPVPEERSTHAVLERLLLPAAAGITTANYRLAYAITPRERENAGRCLAGLASEPRRWIALQPASFPTKPYRNWPPGHFIGLARMLLRDQPNSHFLIFGGPEDTDIARGIAQGIGARATAIAGLHSLRASAALLARMALYIGVDTGLTHLAGAIGIPAVAIYHCLHPGRNLAPLQPLAPFVAIEHPHDSEPCGHGASLSNISYEHVRQHIAQLPDNPWHDGRTPPP
jgi:heptosyltransferase-3